MKTEKAELLKRLEKGRETTRRKKAEGTYVIRTPYEAGLHSQSLRKSINAYCFECGGHTRKEVTLCTVTKCPLYNVRPWQNPASKNITQESNARVAGQDD